MTQPKKVITELECYDVINEDEDFFIDELEMMSMKLFHNGY